MLVTLVFAMVCVATSMGNTCTVDQLRGKCIDVDDCEGESVSGKCPGASNIQCCVPAGDDCSANGKDGVCIDKAQCAGTSVAGKCPGAANIQCCINGGSSSSGSSAGLCGNYAGATVSSIAGNGNVIYSVVKIKQDHLSTPGSYSMAPTDSDNTMTTSTACAFDKMATAAKAAGVRITINSGFRTIARQQYFWNCYQSKACNGGNLAARPGTSNHGRGVALDLNTDCGKQTAAKPNCGGSAVYQWLYNNGHKYGFTRTVKSEPWHWEYVGAGAERASFA